MGKLFCNANNRARRTDIGKNDDDGIDDNSG
jgi:hypothetical protein